MLRDRLVCGINDDYIQRRLLSEPRLNFKKAMELALGLETAVKNARELQSSGREFASMEGVNKLDSGDSEAAKPCYRCGKTSHLAWKCPFREAKCFNCGKKFGVSAAVDPLQRERGARDKQYSSWKQKWLKSRERSMRSTSCANCKERKLGH